MKAKHLDVFTDYGFKKLFGEEASKPLLLDFLNALIPSANKIVNLTFNNNELKGVTFLDRWSIFDVYCENEQGEKFVIELQKAKQNYFIERTLFYSSFPITEQAEMGDWSFELKAIYCIGILDFTFSDYDNDFEKREVVHTIKLKDQKNKIFYDKITFIYIEIPNFRKQEPEIHTRLDQWLYFIKNLEDFQTIPDIFNDKIFHRGFEMAELGRFNELETQSYERSLKVYRDLINVIDYGKIKGRMEGREEGKAEGKTEVARMLKVQGISYEIISISTGLSIEEINNL